MCGVIGCWKNCGRGQASNASWAFHCGLWKAMMLLWSHLEENVCHNLSIFARFRHPTKPQLLRRWIDFCELRQNKHVCTDSVHRAGWWLAWNCGDCDWPEANNFDWRKVYQTRSLIRELFEKWRIFFARWRFSRFKYKQPSFSAIGANVISACPYVEFQRNNSSIF